MRTASITVVVLSIATILLGAALPASAPSPSPSPAKSAATAAASLPPEPNAPAPSSVADGYKRPTVTIPYAYRKPTIDGTINDEEWQGAQSTNALQTTTHLISPRQTRYWMMWDEDNLYVAMRSPLREGERVIQANRQTDHDINVVVDDSYEIWLDANTCSPDGQPVFFQFLCNYAGARWDVLHEPAVGNTRLGWTAGWQPRNRITPDGKAWEMEMVIPRASLYRQAPFVDGFSLTCLVARNFKNPWEQNSFEGTSSFDVRDSHSKFRLSKAAPAVHLLRVADPNTQALGLELAVLGPSDGKVVWNFDSDGNVHKTGTIAYSKGKLALGGGGMDLDKPGPGSFRIRVTADDGNTTLLDWAALRKFGDLKTLVLNEGARQKGDSVLLSVVFNPVADYVRAVGDFIDFDDRARIDRCDFVVVGDPNGALAGKEFARASFKLDELSYVRGVIRMKDLPFGQYVTNMTALDKNGAVVLQRQTPFTKKDHTLFAWWNTTAGNKDKVLKPWTPVELKQSQGPSGESYLLKVWGRAMSIGDAGLPAQFVSQGKDILASPARLEAQLPGGTVVSAKRGEVKFVQKEPYRCSADVVSAMGQIDVASRVTVEYDGMYKVEMTLTPRSSVEIKGLRMVIPIDPATAEFIYGKGEGIRSGFYMGFLPKDKKGNVWDCRTVDSQPMAVGSFIPYVWIGDTERGLCWFADSDQGWTPNDEVPAFEVRHDGASCDLVFNFISSSTTLDKPRKIVFAFEASPAKEMHKGWRMDTWWCGDTFVSPSWVYPDRSGSTIWQSLPFSIDFEACRKNADARRTYMFQYYSGGKSYHANVVPYYEFNSMGQRATEVPYFGEEWRASSGPLYHGKTLTDYIVYHLDQWCKASGIDGWYLDNVRPSECRNIDAGRGYLLPDGRVQPTYNMFGMRDFFLRLRAVFEENGKAGKIVNHMTNNMILPWNGAVDICYDGERNVIYPEMGKDFMDLWSLERLRLDVPGQWGSVINFMQEYQGKWPKEALAKAMRAYDGFVLLHDALPTGNSFPDQKVMLAGRDRFGIDADDVRFIGYWQKDCGLACATQGVHLAAWVASDGKGKNKLLLAVVNSGEKTDAAITIDLDKLGLPQAGAIKTLDAEAGQPIQGFVGGKLVVPVERHDYRQIILSQ